MNKSKKLYIYATIMIVSFLFAVIAFITITLKNIVSFNSYESSSVYEIETITTCTTSETLSTTYSTSTNTLTTSTYTQTSSTATETTSKNTSNETTTVTTLTYTDQIIAITNYQIVVIPDETTVLTTTTTSEQINKTTTVAITYGSEDVRSSANFVKTFTRGTYYPDWEGYGSTQVYGGSGRLLMDCSIKDDEIKGSISCKYIQEKYGYNYNGARTIVYLDIPEVPDLSGFYSVDDSCLRDDTIDFYFTYKANCPFMNQGVLKTITCYIVPNGGNN